MYASRENAPNKDHKNWNSSNFSNSLFGNNDGEHAPPRLIISCPEKCDSTSKLVPFTKSIEKLLLIGGKKFDFQPTKVVTKDGDEVDDMSLIEDGDHLFLVSDSYRHYAPLRVTISCPEKCNSTSKLVPLPKSIEELLFIGGNKFGFQPTKIVTKDGDGVDDMRLIRDDDHLFLVTDFWNGRNSSILKFVKKYIGNYI